MPIDRQFPPRLHDTGTVKGRVDQVFADYDHNRNGVIELHKPANGVWNTHEMPGIGGRAPHRQLDERFKNGGYSLCDSFSHHGFVTPTDKTHLKLFEAADTNHDQRVTHHELEAVIERYDDNKDGQLDVSEASRLDGDFPEKTVTFQQCGPVMF